jgi:hypothetical protein
MSEKTVISGAQVFDGEEVLGTVDVQIENGVFTGIGETVDREGAEVVEVANGT